MAALAMCPSDAAFDPACDPMRVMRPCHVKGQICAGLYGMPSRGMLIWPLH